MKQNLTRSLQLVQSIYQAVDKNTSIQANSSLLLALSGGQDSMALLSLLVQRKKQRRYRIALCWCHHLWHCNAFHTMHHLMRLSFTLGEPISLLLEPTTDPPFLQGEGGAADESERIDVGLRLGVRRRSLLTFYDGLLSSQGRQKRRPCTEEAARSWRYQSCQRLAIFQRHRMVQVGHSGSDRIETALFNLLRGSGMKGVAAIQRNRILGGIYPKQFCFSNFYGVDFETFE